MDDGLTELLPALAISHWSGINRKIFGAFRKLFDRQSCYFFRVVTNGWQIWFLAFYSKLFVGNGYGDPYFNASVPALLNLSFAVCTKMDVTFYASCDRHTCRYSFCRVRRVGCACYCATCTR